MARCAAAGRTSALPTTVRGPSLYATASVSPTLREIGIFNTTTTGVVVGLVRATTTGTQGAAITAVCESDASRTVLATPRQTHTADPTVGAVFRQASLGAAVGSGIIWTFGDRGLVIPAGTSNGIVIVVPSGTAQHLDFYFVWDE